MMNYTKGEWKVSYNGRIEDREHFSVTTDTIQVAKVHPRRDGKEAEANANLIALAPNMYEALKFTVRQIEELHKLKGDFGLTNAVLGIIALTLAKAEG